MLSPDDPRWRTMLGGYRVRFDPRSLLAKLEQAPEDPISWSELIEGSYHQGDVGEASYAAVVLLAHSDAITEVLPWELLALVAMIELARGTLSNPPVPQWIQEDYESALGRFALLCSRSILDETNPEAIRGMLVILAISKGLLVYASAIDNYSEDELKGYLPS